MANTFELFTTEGEQQAAVLIGGICRDVEDDRLTRRQALDRLADGLERIAASDEAVSDPGPMQAFSSAIGAAFARAGFVAVTAEELRKHFETWTKKGAPVVSSGLPRAVSLTGEAARALTEAVAPLFRQKGVHAAVSSVEPWLARAFQREAAASADIVFFTWTGDLSGNPQFGGLVMGEDGSLYLEDIAAQPDPALLLQEGLIKREGINYDVLAADLVAAAEALMSANVAANLVNNRDRLVLTLVAGEDGMPRMGATWDGEPLAAAKATIIPLATSVPLGTIIPSVTFTPAEEEVVPASEPAPEPALALRP